MTLMQALPFEVTAPVIPSNLDVAINLGRRKVAVFPCDPGPPPLGKSPCGGIKWQDVPIGDLSWIKLQWSRFPDTVVGMHLRDQGILVIDADGIEGQNQWAFRVAEHGCSDDGPCTKTPNGTHRYFRLSSGLVLSNGLGDFTPKRQGGKIDVRGPGTGYVIAPGSQMLNGQMYCSLGNDQLTLLDAPLIPDWLLTLLQARRPQPAAPAPLLSKTARCDRPEAWSESAFQSEVRGVAFCGEGSRNDTLNTAAFNLSQIVAEGFLDEARVRGALIDASRQNGSYEENPSQVESTIRSGMNGGKKKPRNGPFDKKDGTIDYEAIGRAASAGNLNRNDGIPSEEEWPAPDLSVTDADASLPPELPLRTTLCPTAADWVLDAAAAKGTSPDYVFAGLISICSGLIGNARRAMPNDEWREPPVLNFALVGRPSSGKSPALDSLTDPLNAMSLEENEDWDDRLRAHLAAKRISAGHLASWERDVTVAINGGWAPPDLPRNADEPKPISKRRIISSDPTTQAAGRLSADNPRGLILHRDELAGWFASMDRYGGGSGGGDRAFWLESYGGRSWAPDRVKDGVDGVSVPRLLWAIVGGIQPDRLNSKLLQGDDDGLAARFIYVWPAPHRPTCPREGLRISRVRLWLKRLRLLP